MELNNGEQQFSNHIQKKTKLKTKEKKHQRQLIPHRTPDIFQTKPTDWLQLWIMPMIF